MSPGRKIVNLALQGGGAHGAFTWGVLDALLEDERIGFEAISGASAGAMNAVVLAAGYATGGTEGARLALDRFWRGISLEGRVAGPRTTLLETWFGAWHMPFKTPKLPFLDLFAQMASPYDFNPLNVNPLKDLIAEQVDFEALKGCRDLKIFISATTVTSGKIKVFTNRDLSPDAVMASACLPMLFHAVEIDGEHYWDGGYMGNPPLFPFFGETRTGDILLVQINPIVRPEVPRTAKDILERVNEITFNGSLLRELRAIDFVNRMNAEGRLDPTLYQTNRVHRIDGAEDLAAYSGSTRLDTSFAFFEDLKAIGRDAAHRFLDDHFDDIGVRGTLDLRGAFA
ncbi:patatin-like phospholipase family protein [Chthonobacter rhizosphaerae]|uniref:patatin-like phospholipase family protein n=1 Tax=Chthonobacter rhizosphaerae TaxID=2735553 RepID=UPI0015EF909A|nr:patatin-like phospholipase family protein [Chthonobacter rhizosphaerae]